MARSVEQLTMAHADGIETALELAAPYIVHLDLVLACDWYLRIGQHFARLPSLSTDMSNCSVSRIRPSSLPENPGNMAHC